MEEKEKQKGPKINRLGPCFACYEEGTEVTKKVCHRLTNCNVWLGLSVDSRKRLTNCLKHLFATDGHKTEDCDKIKVSQNQNSVRRGGDS